MTNSLSHSPDPQGEQNRTPSVYAVARQERKARHLDRTRWRCWYCGCALTLETVFLDHVVAKSKGGKGHGNYVPVCRACNNAKRARSVEEFRTYLSRKQADIPYFTPTQLAWLADQGFEFPETQPVVFWFEKEGL